jgi:acetyl-CoA carboxylase carboxyl transferase subunit beta
VTAQGPRKQFRDGTRERRIQIGSGVVVDTSARVLLVLRRFPPEAGHWSVPGGRVEPGESVEEAVAREVLEETGLVVSVRQKLGSLDIPGAARNEVYEVHDFLAVVVGGRLRAGDDASDARWVTRDQALSLMLTDRLIEILDSYGVFS